MDEHSIPIAIRPARKVPVPEYRLGPHLAVGLHEFAQICHRRLAGFVGIVLPGHHLFNLLSLASGVWRAEDRASRLHCARAALVQTRARTLISNTATTGTWHNPERLPDRDCADGGSRDRRSARFPNSAFVDRARP